MRTELWSRGRRRHFKLGGMTLRRRAFSKNKMGTSLFISKSWGDTCPQCHLVPMSMLERNVLDCLVFQRNLRNSSKHLKCSRKLQRLSSRIVW